MSSQQQSLNLRRVAKLAGISVCVAGIFGVLALFGITLARLEERVAAVWLPNALLLGLLIYRGESRQGWVLLAAGFAGNLTANLLVGDPLTNALGLATANALEIAIVWRGVVRRPLSSRNMADSQDLLRFCVFSVKASAMSALVAVLTLAPSSLVSAASIGFGWLLTDSLSLMLLTPALLILADGGARQFGLDRAARREWILIMPACMFVTTAIFAQNKYPLLFAVIPLCCLAAYRLGVVATAQAILGITAIAMAATINGSGPIHLSASNLGEKLIVLQLFLATTFLVSLPVAAQIRRRQMAEAQSDASARRLSNLITMAPVGILHVDGKGAALEINPALFEMTGLSDQQAAGRGWLAPFAHEDYGARLSRWLAEATASSVLRLELQAQRADNALCWIELTARPQIDASGCATGCIITAVDTTAHKVAAESLRLAIERTEQAAAAKSTFLAHMSHEIRTPMNGVLGFAELLLGENLSPAQRRSVEMIANSGRAMMRLLNDILDITKIEAGKIAISLEPVDVRHKLHTVANLLRPNADSKGLDLKIIVAPEVPEAILADALRIRQILLNLTGNAVKFTARGSVSLDASAVRANGRQWLRIAVRDTGIGIAADKLDSIFGQFTQADDTTSRRYGGTGLGLAISAELAGLLGGRIEATSELGKGSEFVLTLPIRRIRRTTPTVERHPVESLATASGLRVLIAEDHDINQELIMALARRAGLDAELAENGKQAVEMVTRASKAGTPYAVVLMDMQMPELDGLEATRRLRAMGFSPETLPIIALTANAYPEDVAACREAGMQAHLAKPLRQRDLMRELSRFAKPAGTRPSDESPASRHSKVEQLYRERREQTLDQLRKLAGAGVLSDTDVTTLIDQLHKLAGTAGMFREPGLGSAASRLERTLRETPRDKAAAILATEATAVLQAA